MRNIAIIGSGQAGLLAAHGLLKAGYSVTLYSDRTAEQWLNESRPTGTAARFHISLEYERELGLNHWEKEAPKGEGVHLTFCPAKDNRLLTLAGRLENYFIAIDLRLQSHRWMNDFAAKGGKIEIENVTVPRLDEIAAAHELTIVAAGRADLCQSVRARRRAQRLRQAAAQSRNDHHDGRQDGFCRRAISAGQDSISSLLSAKLSTCRTFTRTTARPGICSMEAKPGGPLDRFGDCKSGEQAVETLQANHKRVHSLGLRLGEGHATRRPERLAGRPRSRRRCASRSADCRRDAIVTPLGDTAMALDPIGGQGANNGNKMARNLVESIIARKDQPFDCGVDDRNLRALLCALRRYHLHVQQYSARADHDRRQEDPDRAIWQRRPRQGLDRSATDRRCLHREFQRRQRSDAGLPRRWQGSRRDPGERPARAGRWPWRAAQSASPGDSCGKNSAASRAIQPSTKNKPPGRNRWLKAQRSAAIVARSIRRSTAAGLNSARFSPISTTAA